MNKDADDENAADRAETSVVARPGAIAHPIHTAPFKAAEFIATHQAQVEFLTEAINSGDGGRIAQAAVTIAKARGISVNNSDDVSLATLLEVITALGLELQLV